MISKNATNAQVLDSAFSKLEDIRKNSGSADTIGLLDSEISKFLSLDSNFSVAINQAYDYFIIRKG